METEQKTGEKAEQPEREAIPLSEKTSQLLLQLSQNAAVARQRLGDAINATAVALDVPEGYGINPTLTAFECLPVAEKAD